MKTEKGKETMEEYIEDILEENDSRMELLESLDFDNDQLDSSELATYFLDDDEHFYNQ